MRRGGETARTACRTRPLGRTGVNVSILCLGGWHIGTVKDEQEAIRIMHAAIDEGMTFFDNAWDYHDGRSEELMGKALADGGRRNKRLPHDQELRPRRQGHPPAPRRQPARLQTDVIDLWQFHEINYDNDPEEIRLAGAGSPPVTRRLQAMLTDLRSIAPPERVGVIDRQLELLAATAASALEDPRDVALSLAGDPRGIGAAASGE